MKNNREEAEILIEYAKIECKDLKGVIPTLDAILADNLDELNWEIAKFIADKTSYIFVDTDVDVDFEEGEWGLPIASAGEAVPTGIDIEDKENLMILRQEVDDLLNHTADRINKFILLNNKPRWECQKCNRFLGKELSSLDEVKKLLRDFNINKYWKCRSCKAPNYFGFNDNGIVFKLKLD